MLKSEKIFLDYIKSEDLNHILEWRNNQKLNKYFREYRVLSMEQQKQWFLKITAVDNDSEFFFMIRTHKNKEPIGVCGINYIHWVNRTAQLSIYIGKNDIYLDTCGFAEEACRILEKYAFDKLNLNKIYCEVFGFDSKKKKLLNKLKYRIEGKLIEQVYRDGRFQNSIIYAKINKRGK